MNRDALFLGEMIEAAQQVVSLASNRTSAELAADRMRRDALLWNFTVLGESAAQLSSELKSAHPHLDWSRPIQLRNRIVHGYWSIDLDILVTTAQDDLPDFLSQLRQAATPRPPSAARNGRQTET
ncbi:MAG: hypothetical protein CSA63_00935 [Propionibacterium sp.]|nr:MAG: hypothetical protein CSA63_00935 [Propionibacterium sp.]